MNGEVHIRNRLVDRVLVRAIGTLSLLGGIGFLAAGLKLIALYLGAAGVAFWIASFGWQKRYQNVLDTPPEGYKPTGEVYPNPPGSEKVAVYFKGIRRVYVKQGQ